MSWLGKIFSGKKTTAQAAPAPRVRKSRVRYTGTSFGSFMSAQYSPYDEGFHRSPVPINQYLSNSLPAMRARSRTLSRDDAYAAKYLHLVRTNVVGSAGYKLVSQVMSRKGAPARGIRAAIESAWKDYSRKGIACAQDRLSMHEMQLLAAELLGRDGEVIAIDYRGEDENRYGISWRFVDADLMPHTYRRDLPNGNKIRMGVEYDARGRFVAIHLISLDATSTWYYEHNARGFIRVPIQRCIFAFPYQYDGQLRGIPPMQTAAMRLRRLSDYEHSEFNAAREGSKKGGFIETNAEREGFGGENTLVDQQVDEQLDDGYIEEDQPEIKLEDGDWIYLEPGAKASAYNPEHPNSGYGAFMKTALRGAASAFNVPYNSLGSDGEGINFSTMRAFENEARDVWRAMQRWQIESVFDVMFDRWLHSAILSGAILLENGTPLKYSNMDKLRRHNFRGRGWTWVDPLKDAQTSVIEVNERLKSRSQIIRERGDDPDEVWQEIENENAELERRGIPPIKATAVTTQTDDTTETNADESNDDE